MNATKNRWVKNVCVFLFPFTIANVPISYRNPIVVLLGLIDRLGAIQYLRKQNFDLF